MAELVRFLSLALLYSILIARGGRWILVSLEILLRLSSIRNNIEDFQDIHWIMVSLNKSSTEVLVCMTTKLYPIRVLHYILHSVWGAKISIDRNPHPGDIKCERTEWFRQQALTLSSVSRRTHTKFHDDGRQHELRGQDPLTNHFHVIPNMRMTIIMNGEHRWTAKRCHFHKWRVTIIVNDEKVRISCPFHHWVW